MKWLRLTLFLDLSLILCLGCGGEQGPQTVPASGVVTLRGNPVSNVTVVFIPRSGPPATGVTDAEGKFVLNTFDQAGAAPGAHQVTIIFNQGEVEMALPGQPPPKSKSPIPEKYATAETSGLTAEVKADGENQFTFDLAD